MACSASFSWDHSRRSRRSFTRWPKAALRSSTGGNGGDRRLHKVRFADKIRALEMLAKHFKLLSDVHEHRFTLEDLVTGSTERFGG